MPKDSKGAFHLNTQRAMAADKIHGASTKMKDAKAPKHEGGGRHITVHDHGDGGYHSDDSEGNRADHPDAMAMQDHVGQWAGGQTDDSGEMPSDVAAC